MTEKKKTGKRKGLGGLSAEKKKLLKHLIMTKAAEEMKTQARERQEAKLNALKSIIGSLDIDGLDEGKLQAKCKELHSRLSKLEEEKYDWEVKIRRQDFEINELTIKVNDVKGKFVKPVLKKISKTESKMAKFDRKTKSHQSFRDQLKSTGQNKFALEEREEDEDKPNWRENKLPPKPEGEDKPAPAEPEPEPESAPAPEEEAQEGQDNEAELTLEIEE